VATHHSPYSTIAIAPAASSARVAGSVVVGACASGSGALELTGAMRSS
jgi:hypothetical protein